MNQLPPKHINGYEIEGIWAEGGLCTLYLAINPITHEHLLIKTLSSLHKQNKEMESRLLNEIHVLSRCQHPNIVKMLSHGSWKGSPFLVLEFIRGASLRKVLAHNPLPLQRALDLFLDICSAVGHMHSLGFVHRDLKPENILITEQGQVKLIDFGLATVSNEITESLPSSILYEGTPAYMSPEAMKDNSVKAITRDIYALGILAYEMILGRISSGKVVLASLPKGLQPIIAHAVQPFPQNRCASVSDLIQAISSYRESQALTQEKQSSDYFFELFDKTEAMRKELNESLSPREIKDCSFALSSSLNKKGLYAATLTQGNEQGFFIVEFDKESIQGLAASIACHYILETLRQTKNLCLLDLFTEVQTTLSKQFACRTCFASIDNSTLNYVFENWGSFYRIHNQEIHPLTATEKTLKLLPHETLVFIGYQPSETFTSLSLPLPDMIQSTVLETTSFPASKQSSTILQRLLMQGEWMQNEHPICVLTLNCCSATSHGL